MPVPRIPLPPSLTRAPLPPEPSEAERDEAWRAEAERDAMAALYPRPSWWRRRGATLSAMSAGAVAGWLLRTWLG
jgi:hypothetical protein